MKLVCISDLHNHFITPPEGDLLLIAGDLTGMGRASEIEAAGLWLDRIVDRYTHGIVLTAGNHDWLTERDPVRALELLNPFYNDKIQYLVRNTCEVAGLKIYGSPDTPEFCNWAWNRTAHELHALWSAIPEGVDIVVTHGPPYGILDKVPRGELVGCKYLRKELFERVKPKAHVFGHIHLGHGTQEVDGIHFINASICTEEYEPINKPIILDV